MVTVYEISRVIVTPLCLIPLGVTVIIGSFFLNELSCSTKKAWMLLIMSGVFFAVSCYYLISFIIFEINNYRKIVSPYFCGEFLTVQGAVSGLKYEKNGSCAFSVGDVFFNCGETSAYPGFFGDKSVVNQDGQLVKIGYINYNGFNIIVEIENSYGNLESYK